MQNKLHGITSLQIIQVYAPTNDHDNEIVVMFHEDFENAMETKSLQPSHSNLLLQCQN